MTRIKELRAATGMTQEELARKANVKLTTLQKLESGANSIMGAKLATAAQIAKALNTPIESLIE